MDYWYRKVHVHVQENRSPKYRRAVRMVGTCHIALGEVSLGVYPGVGAFHASTQNSYLGAYPGVGTYRGDYGMFLASTS